jgi:uncharacterized protein YcbX
MATTIAQLFRYPIKGLSAESMARVTLTPGHAFPGDRRFALRHANSAFDPAIPTWQRKREFAMLAHTAELAKLQTTLDADTGTMRMGVAGQTVFAGNVLSAPGRRAAESAINAVINDARGALQVVDAGNIALTDMQQPYLSIINLASLQEFAGKIGQSVDVARFRGNIIIDGLVPWAEFDWIGKSIHIGSTVLSIPKRIERCAATTVNPNTAERDLDVPSLLRQHYGHIDCGVFGAVNVGGEISVGDVLVVS